MSRLNLILALKGKKAVDDNAGEIKSPPLVTTPMSVTTSDLATMNPEHFQETSPTIPTIPSTFQAQAPTNANQSVEEADSVPALEEQSEPVEEQFVQVANVTEQTMLETEGVQAGVLPQETIVASNQEIVPEGPIESNPDPGSNNEAAPLNNAVQPENPELTQNNVQPQ